MTTGGEPDGSTLYLSAHGFGAPPTFGDDGRVASLKARMGG